MAIVLKVVIFFDIVFSLPLRGEKSIFNTQSFSDTCNRDQPGAFPSVFFEVLTFFLELSRIYFFFIIIKWSFVFLNVL